MHRSARTLSLLATLTLAAGAAAAHSGHGHDSLNFMQGLRHALGEPDHLLLLAFGFGLTSWAAPRVWRALSRLLQARRSPRQAGRLHDVVR